MFYYILYLLFCLATLDTNKKIPEHFCHVFRPGAPLGQLALDDEQLGQVLWVDAAGREEALAEDHLGN